MELNRYHEYSYQELLEKATSDNATQKDIDTLGEWFNEYGIDYWNGEVYDVGNGMFIKPISEEVSEGTFETVRYELY